jgi:glycosyltransferase involved in cell wall biosynthesis
MTNLELGNSSFREAKYIDAIRYYNLALQEHPELSKTITANLNLAKNRNGLSNESVCSEENINDDLKNQLLIGVSKDILSRAEKLFDHEFYAQKNPNIVVDDGNFFQHFCNYGWREQHDPNPLFSVQEYLRLHPDALKADINPLFHYVTSGGMCDIGGIFDTNYYLGQYPEVCDKDLLPFEHFVFFGLRNGMQPSCGINPSVFLTQNEMVLSPWVLAGLLADRIRAAASTIDPIEIPAFNTPELSIIIYARNNVSSVVCCIDSIRKIFPSLSFELLIADDGSHDLLPELTCHWKGIKRVASENDIPNWATAINRAAEQTTGSYIAIIDGNCEPTPGWFDELRYTLDRDQFTAITGGKLLNVSGTLKHAGGVAWNNGSLTNLGTDVDPTHPNFSYCKSVDYVSPSLMMVRADIFLRLGGFKAEFAEPDYAAADFSFEARKYGWKTIYQPMAQAISYSTLREPNIETGDLHIFRRRWKCFLKSYLDGNVDDTRGVVGHALVIDQTTPTPDQDSGSIDQFNLLEILVQLGWKVSFVPEIKMEHKESYTHNLQRIGVQCIYAPHYNNLWEFVKDEGEDLDLVILYKGPTAVHYLNIIESFCTKAKFILDTVDIHFLREMREAELLNDDQKKTKALHTKSLELEAIRRTDCTLILSTAEEKIIRTEIPYANLAILPLIRDIPGRQAPFSELNDVCFIGGFLHQPNCDAIHYFVQNIWPLVEAKLPTIRFRIMGSNVPPDIQALHGGSIIVDGFVPDMLTSFARCRVSVAPLRYGAGLKGKVASSLGFGIPCVATPIAAEGMGDGASIGVEVASDPHDFADCIVRLYNDPEYWMKQSQLGLEFVNNEYSICAIKLRFSTILQNLGLPIRLNPAVINSVIAHGAQNHGYAKLNKIQGRSEVSVVIPLYNHEQYIATALESIFSQTRPPAEVIVIDDGSSDQSYDVASRLSSGFPGAILWKQSNRGAHNTINTCIQRASQPVIAILNSDDVFHANRLERCLEIMKESGAAIVASEIEFIDGSGSSISNKWYDEAIASWKNIGNSSLALLNANYLMTTSNLVIHRSVFKDIGFFKDFRYTHDLDFFIRALAAGHKIEFIPEPLLKYRYHSSNTISENHTKVRAEWAYICAEALCNPSGGLLEGMSSLDYCEKLLDIAANHQLSKGLLMLLQGQRNRGRLEYSTITKQPEFLQSLYRSVG